jgi:hypothetical protein
MQPDTTMRRSAWHAGKIWLFVSDAGGWAVASNTTAIVLYVIGLISASKYGASITTFIIVAVSVPLFWVGAFIAWNKQYEGRLQAEKKRANRPFIAPRSYKRHEDHRFGLTVTNSEYAGFHVHIPDAPVGESGYVLQFDGIFSELLPGEHAFFETSLENRNGLPGCDGSQLFTVMVKADVKAVNFGIISKDTAPIPNWYRDNCAIRCDNRKHRTGLVLRHINQEVIPEPPID